MHHDAKAATAAAAAETYREALTNAVDELS
jgi:hypothetical protein